MVQLHSLWRQLSRKFLKYVHTIITLKHTNDDEDYFFYGARMILFQQIRCES